MAIVKTLAIASQMITGSVGVLRLRGVPDRWGEMPQHRHLANQSDRQQKYTRPDNSAGNFMVEQPHFGRRLKELRTGRGLSQAALAGDGMSTGYLSRLESGARQPTEKIIKYMAERLGVDRSVFDEPTRNSLAQALTIAASAGSRESIEDLITVLSTVHNEDPSLRWQALWLVAQYRRMHGERVEEQDCLEELVTIADELELPELQCRARTQLARCLRSSGEITKAIKVAMRAYQSAREAKLPTHDLGPALLALVSVEAEAGRLPDASGHADELVTLVDGQSDTLRAEALWAAATVRIRQGDYVGAEQCLEEALKSLSSRTDLVLWVRLRLAAASLYLQSRPPRTENARHYLEQVASPVALVGTTVLRQELTTLQAHLAFHEGRFSDARARCAELGQEGDLLLTYRDQIRLNILQSQLAILDGRASEGVERLRQLGDEAQQASSIDLAAEAWRILAEHLAESKFPRGAADA
ncbi:helix-turn-helix domain-containing protein [Streptomyces lunalinharesii]|uniref:helix-turn-helix domain-containing protein n=1 Tax=Streptomyces lunalinharesii TaxID=333384 RepID=UPI0031DA8222